MNMFALIQTGGKQYKVAKGDILEVEKMEVEEGSSFNFDQVLLINDGKTTTVGKPLIEGAVVKAKVLGHVKADKIIVFKMKAKKRYEKTQGHRQHLVSLEITDISNGSSTAKKETVKKEDAVEKPAPKKKASTAKKTAKAA